MSPSVLGYLVHKQFFNFVPKPFAKNKPIINKINNSLYLLSVKEWNLDFILHRFLRSPFKWVGKKLGFMPGKMAMLLMTVIFLFGLYADFFRENVSARCNAIHAWIFVVAGQLYIALSIALLNENFGSSLVLIYLGGSLISAVIGLICLKKIRAIDNDIELNQFHGYIYEQPVPGFIFLIACLGMIGLPFTPTFIGIDLLFSHIHKHEKLIIISTALSFAFIELSILRIYARVFLGQHKKVYHPVAYRSS